MIGSGMKASEVIRELQALIAKHGDRPVFSGGEDYPGPVKGVRYEAKGDGYVAKDSFDIVGGL